MKFISKRCIGIAIAIGCLIASSATAQESPTLRVDITRIAVDTDGDGVINVGPPIVLDPDDEIFDGTPGSAGTPNESFGLANTRVYVLAQAAGTFTTESFTYSFFVNGVSIGASPSAITTEDFARWVPPRPGVYYLTVTATDGVTTVTSPTIRYYAVGASITSPLQGTLVPVGSSVTIKADATPQQGSIAGVEFFADGSSIGTDNTAPYSFIYTPAAASGATVNLTVTATDSLGATTSSSAVPITMVNAVGSVPTVEIASPGDQSVIAVPTDPIPITVTANDADGRIERVEVYVDGVLFATDLSFPYTASWSPVAVGQYLVSALAYDDKNNVVASPVSTVNISAPPAVSITSPSAGTSVSAGAAVTVVASASDADGTVGSVQFFGAGTFIGEDFTAPYTITWTPAEPDPDDPTIGLTALATDNVGLTTLSAGVSVTVQGSGGSGGGGTVIGNAPTGSLTSPKAGSSLPVNSPILLTADAADSDGNITKVQFYANSYLVGTDSTYPYSVEWTPTAVANYSLEIRITDNDANVVTSSTVAIAVVDPSSNLPTISINSPASGSTVQTNTVSTVIVAASDSDGSVASVQLYIDGQVFGTPDTVAPYTFSWTPTGAGVYALTARATDNSGNLATSAAVSVTAADSSSSAPSVSIASPLSGESMIAGSVVSIVASASDPDGQVASVQFFVDGRPQGAADQAEPFTVDWTPSSSGNYSINAVAIDASGNQTTSQTVSVTVVSNGAPTVALTSPSSGTTVQQGTPVSLAANATDADGSIAAVQFIANGIQIGSATTSPYTISWTAQTSGTFSIVARAIDNSGNRTDSSTVIVSAIGNGAPSVAMTFPNTGSTITLGESVELKASASDTNGVVAGVQFYANGVPIGTPDSTGPFTANWTPASAGIYRLVATATDNGGQLATSETLIVAVQDTAEADFLYTGIYLSGQEQGYFKMAKQGERSGTFIGYRAGSDPKIYFYNGLSIDASGGFSLNQAGSTVISGTAGETGAFGKFDGERVTFSGTIVVGVPGNYSGPTGTIHGSLNGQSGSRLIGLIGTDASVTFYVSNGGKADVANGSLASDGTFDLSTIHGGTLKGKIDPQTGFLTGSISGSQLSGTFSGAASTPAPASDGFLRNLSTRGFVGSGDAILVAGFVVSGDTPKQVLVRAIGPTLADFGVTGVVSDPLLKLYNSSNAVISSNDDWGTDPSVPNASSTVGAFALPTGSADSALVTTLNPGAYTAQISGVGGATGVGLVEIYDVDNQTPFSADKMLNVSTRGQVGDQELIAGVIINGTTSKRVMIRAVGPTLSQFGVSGELADPVLRLVNQANGAVVRENNDWQMGNDGAEVAEAAARVGAFALPAGSKDAVLLITLPPGRYTALVNGASGSAGLAIVEVYEVP